jgi:hypothetical protein
MHWTWFDLHWPWIGLLAAVLLLPLLFLTNAFRSRPDASRWRDPVWLAWLAVPLYMLHQFEEYGIDLLGRRHEFPKALCQTLGTPVPQCPIPEPFYAFVNVPLIWVAAPLAATLGRRFPLVGLSYYGLLVTNGLVHLAAMFTAGYNPGLLTGVLFMALFLWCAAACFGAGGIRYEGLALLVVGGALSHAVLMGSVAAFMHGHLSTPALLAIQVLNAFLLPLVAMLAEKRWAAQVRPSRAL